MTSISAVDASVSLQLLADNSIQLEQDVQKFQNQPDVESGEENDSNSPIFDSFFASR